MCVMSVVSDWGHRNVRYPDDYTTGGTTPTPVWTRDSFNQFKEILDKLRELDDKLGLAHPCGFRRVFALREVEERLAVLEAH